MEENQITPPPTPKKEEPTDKIERELTINDMMVLTKKRYKVYIPNLGYIIIRRATGNDISMSMAISDNGKDPILYQNQLVSLCMEKPKLAYADQVSELPEGIALFVLRKINELSRQFGDSDFLVI